jgi:beta-xylosidase
MYTLKKLLLLCSFFILSPLLSAQEGDSVYLFSYFVDNGQDGLHLAWSGNGLRWEALNNNQSFLKPEAGKDKLMRDPCIIQTPDGLFHMVWTVSWGEKGIGYARSTDLVHWSEQHYIPVMEHEKKAMNCWAPEIFFDESKGEFIIFWSTTIPGRFPETDGTGDGKNNHRMYYVTSKDMRNFSETRLFYDPGFNSIDGTLLKDGDRYLMFLKDETKRPVAKKNIRVATATSSNGPWSQASEPIYDKDWAEGPTIAKIGDRWILYFDRYTADRFGAISSTDLENWEDISNLLNFPEGTRHGTILKVSRATVNYLKNPKKQLADRWKYMGIAVEEEGYTVWGSSPIMDEEGQVHLFVARWPAELKVDPGWRSHSEIAHYVGPSPLGPFEFSDMALTGSGRDTWDKYSVHNPAIHKVGDHYVLLYIGNNNPETPPHPANQHIGMALSSSLDGPWERVNGNGLILSPPEDSSYWNYKASNGVNNPALLCHPNGMFYLYFKSEGGRMGLATSSQVTGPYVQLPEPVTSNAMTIEDGYAFLHQDKICLLTTDNHGILEKGGGLLWVSADGLDFGLAAQGFYPVEEYLGNKNLQKAKRHYGGNIIKFERPQLLMINKEPAYLYVTSGYHFFGKESTASYVLRLNKE